MRTQPVTMNPEDEGLFPVSTGLDTLLQNPRLLDELCHLRLGILAHAASVNQKGKHILELFRENNIPIARVFAPEHGLWAAAQDMEGVEHGFDPIAETEIYSLYGRSLESLSPHSDAIADLDCVLIDLQDVGARYYTFIYSAWLLTQTCLKAHKHVYILDRPNPIDGVHFEGNINLPEFRSFVGYMPLKTRHGKTIGELQNLWAQTYLDKECQHYLHILKMKGWKREMMFDETGLPWVMPSPNMPTLETALVYPGQCLLEGTNLSEGRGTTKPFELFGAPWLKIKPTLDALDALQLQGVSFRPLRFKPTFQKYANEICNGFQMHVTHRKSFEPVKTSICLLSIIYALHPNDFKWRTETYEFVDNILAIDLLFGTDSIRKRIETQCNPLHICRDLTSIETVNKEEADKFLFY